MTGNIVYTYRGSWCAEGLNTTWEAEWRALGTRGSAQWDGGNDLHAATVTGRTGLLATSAPMAVPESDPGLKVGGHAGLLREFVACVETGATPETNGADNIRSLAMVFAAIESAETGRRVAVQW